MSNPLMRTPGLDGMMTMRIKWRLVLVAVVAQMACFVPSVLAQSPVEQGEQVFRQKCIGCHTIGQGDRVGPDLQGVTQRRERSWLEQWISAPDQMIAQGDPIAVELLNKYKIRMPNMGLSRDEVLAVIAYLESASAGQIPSPTAALQLPTGDPIRGKSFFTGVRRFQNGGPPCLACHSVAGIGALGGGLLGPDLTGVLNKYGGVQGLAAFISSPGTPVMGSVWPRKPLTPQELADVIAFLQQASVSERPLQIVWQFIGLAFIGVAILAGVAALYWRNRLAGGLRRRWLGYS